LPASEPDRAQALQAAQVTTRSPMGAIVYETGGLLIDDGWLRVLGSGHARLPRTLGAWNAGRASCPAGQRPSMWIVADDAVGGSFAINGGVLPGGEGHVHYFAPDSLRWESLERDFTAFVQWVLAGDLEGFYANARWPGWRGDVAALPGDHAFHVYPPMWAKGPPIGERSRRAVPMAELLDLQFDVARQLDGDA
jgi:hypothetical protein